LTMGFKPYNLLKHKEGLGPLRVRSQRGVMPAAKFAQMTTLLLEIVGTRRTPQEGAVPKQLRALTNHRGVYSEANAHFLIL
jgi:hypothetical protein